MFTNTLQKQIPIPTYEDFLQQAEWWNAVLNKELRNNSLPSIKAREFIDSRYGDSFSDNRISLHSEGESFLCLLIAEMLSTGDFE